MHRLVVLRVVLIVILATLVGRLYQLQLVEGEVRRFDRSIEVNTTRYVHVHPRRGEILARDGETLLAESVPTFALAVLPGQLPDPQTRPEQRALVLGRLARIAELTSTLTLSPALALKEHPTLHEELQAIGDPDLLSSEPGAYATPSGQQLQIAVAPAHTLAAIELAGRYPSLLSLTNPIEEQVSRHTTPYYQLTIIKENVPQEMALAIRENTAHIPGIAVVEYYRRRYPLSGSIPTLSHMLGYIGRINQCELVAQNPATSWTDSLFDVLGHVAACSIVSKQINPFIIGVPPYLQDDWIGKDGLEASYESELRGAIGIETLLVDALERPVGERRTLRHMRDGNDLVLTIDPWFQRETAAILQQWIDEAEHRRMVIADFQKEYHPITNGVALVLDVRSGDVLAMVSLPAYDNNIWVHPDRSDELQALLAPDDPEQHETLARLAPLTNRAISGQYPPGSVLKQFVGAIALQEGVIGPDTLLRDPGRLILEERGGHLFVLPNSTRRDNGRINVSDALKVSSNVFFASLAGGNEDVINLGPADHRIRGLTIDGLSSGLRWFLFGQPTGIALPGEASGRVPSPIWKLHALREPWTTGDTYNTTIGQGYLEVTPIQLITAAAAVANGGTLYRPHLVRAALDSQRAVLWEQQPEIVSHIPVDPAYLAVIREGMRRSVTEGANVAARDALSGLSIAGKTGTAEFGPIITRLDGTPTRQSHAWFVGFAPYSNPQVIALVLIEGAGDLNDGSATLAVPAVTQILQTYFHNSPPTEAHQED